MGVLSEFQSIMDLSRDIHAHVREQKQRATTSLTAYTKQTNIMSRMYIEQSIVNDDITLPLIGALQQLYCCYILAALNLDTFCTNGRTVREVFNLVATEGQSPAYDAVELIGATFGENEMDLPVQKITTRTIPSEEALGIMDLEKDSQRLVSGRLIEVDIVVPSKGKAVNSANSFKAYLYVQLIPYVLSKETAAGFLGANFSPSLSTRWKQMRAGEISFIKDFIFSRDLINKQQELIKQDKGGVLYDMLIKQRSSLFKWIMGLAKFLPENHNLANSILILDKSTFKKACTEAKVDFTTSSGRQAFFKKTFTMIVVVVDLMYGQVEMYFNGVDSKGTYTFKMIESVGAKGKKDINYSDVMLAYSKQMSPKF